MVKIDDTLINKYINGDEIDEKTIEELEDNREFMTAVIDKTNDKKLYSLCSDRLKGDLEFAKFLVNKFKDDIDFVLDFNTDYLVYAVKHLEDAVELSIIVRNNLPEEEAYYMNCFADELYYASRLETELGVEKNPFLRSQIGMGFIGFYDAYHDRKIVLDYYARKMVKEIINGHDIDKIVHNQFSNPEKLKEVGIKNYSISLIRSFDSMLSSYVSTNIELISEFEKEINKIIVNWSKFSNADELIRYNRMIDMVHHYMSDSSKGDVSEASILYLIAYELNIDDKVRKYDRPAGTTDEENDLDIYYDEMELEFIRYEIKGDIRAQLDYLNVRKIIINQLFSKQPLNFDTLTEKKNKKKLNKKKKNEE